MTPEEIESLNSLVALKETEVVVKNLPRKKPVKFEVFINKANLIFEVQIVPKLPKILWRISKKERLPRSICNANITWIPKKKKNRKESTDKGQMLLQ